MIVCHNSKFGLNLEANPNDFVKAGITVQGKRHLLATSIFMLSLLVTVYVKTIYLMRYFDCLLHDKFYFDCLFI